MSAAPPCRSSFPRRRDSGAAPNALASRPRSAWFGASRDAGETAARPGAASANPARFCNGQGFFARSFAGTTRRGAAARAFVVALALALAAPAAAVDVQQVVSPGGIEAWLVEERSAPILSLRFAFRGGSRLDPPGKEGLAELASGLLDEGAGDLDALAFQTALEDNAIRLRFDVGLDEFGGSLQTLTERRDRAVELLSLALSRPRFDADAVGRVRDQLVRGLERETTDARAIARRAWYRAAFADHPYARPSGGTVEGVGALTRADLAAFARDRFARDRLVVGAAGDIGADELGGLLDSAFGALPASGPAFDVPETALAAAGRVVVEPLAQPQTVIVWGQRGLKRDDADYYAAYVMNQILGGGGFTSRLYREVRERRGLAYGVYSYLAPLDRAGLYLGGVATRNERAAEALAVVRAEFARMRDEGVSADELADARTYINGSFPLRLDSNREVASILVGMQIAGLGVDYLDRRAALIDGVSREDIARVAAALIDPDSFLVVAVGEPVGIADADGE